MNRHWTPHQTNELARLVNLAQSWAEVAEWMQTIRPGINADGCRRRAFLCGMKLGIAGEPWTVEQDAALRRLAEAGVRPWAKVAGALQAERPGGSVESVKQRAKKLGLLDAARAWTHQQEAMLERMMASGATCEDVAEAMEAERPGVTATAVRAKAIALGLDFVMRPVGRPTYCRRTIGEMADTGATAEEVAAAVGCHLETARRTMRLVRR